MASTSPNRVSSPVQNKSLVSVCKQFALNGIKPITKKNLLFHYAPLIGAANYTALSVNVLNPTLVIRMFPKKDLTNFLLFNTLLGTGLYIYSRPHMSGSPSRQRVGFSAYSSLMFSFGSVLVWAVMRSVLPENTIVCTAVGVASSVALIRFGTNYMDYVDKRLETAAK